MSDITIGEAGTPSPLATDTPTATPSPTNEYDTLLAQAPAPQPAAPAANPYDSVVIDMAKERNQRVRGVLLGAQQSTPDQAAKAANLAQKTGVPSDVVERNLQKVDGDTKLNEYDQILEKSPKLASWLLTDQINAKVASAEGDFEKLGFLEHTINEAFWRPYYSGRVEAQEKQINQAVQLGADLESALARKAAGETLSAYDEGLVKDEGAIRDVIRQTIMDAGTERSRRQQQAAALPQRPNVVEMQKAGREGDWEAWWKAFDKDKLGAFYTVALQSMYTLPAQLAAGAVGGPAGAGAVSFGTEYWGALMDALEESGVDINDPTQLTQAFADPAKMAKVKEQATIKAGTIATLDAVSFGVASKFLGIGRRMVTRTATNIPAQIAVQGALGGLGEAGGSYLAGMKVNPDAVMAEIMGEGFGAPAEVATADWRAARRADMTAKQWETFQALPPVEQRAEAQALSIDKLVAIANDTKLATASPAKLQEFIASVSGADASVFVPAEALRTFMQDMTGLQAQQFADRLGIADQLKRIAATNEDVAIPLARYITGASEAHAAWRDQIRTEVDGFSIREAQEFEKAKATQVEELQKRFEEQIQAGVTADPATVVYQQVMAMLKANGYTNEVAAQHAALYAARYETRAARNPSRYADALDAFQQAGPGTGMTIQTVLPDGTRALGPDVFDVLLNSIRSGKDPIVPPAHFAHLEARKEAQRAALEPVLGPEPAPEPPTPKQIAEARNKAAMEAFKAQRQEVADALASMGIDLEKMTNAQVREAVTKQAEGTTYQQDAVEEATDDIGPAIVQSDIPTTVDDAASYDNTLKMARGQNWQRGRDLKVAMQNAVEQMAAEAGVDVSKPSPQTTDYLVRVGVRDALFALKQNPNAIGWYDLKTRQALSVMALMHPEIVTNPDMRFAFVWALAVTSNGQKVGKNFELAEQVYSRFKKTGVMPSDLEAGQAQKAINKSLALYNDLVKRWGKENLRRFMLTSFSVAEITGLDAKLKPSGEHAETMVRGAAVLGPKIGNGFFSNLYGHFDALTMDRWLVRTWGRWTGTLISPMPTQTAKANDRLGAALSAVMRDDAEAQRLSAAIGMDLALVGEASRDALAYAIQKASMDKEIRAVLNKTDLGVELRKSGNRLATLLDGQKEQPGGPAERTYIRSVFSGILATLQQRPEYADLTMADLQAVLWYAEKRLYETAKEDVEADAETEGYGEDEAPDYANAAVAVAAAAGVSKRRIQGALAKEANDGRAGSGERPAGEAGPRQAGQGQQAAARGFAPGEKRTFIGAAATWRARSNRVGSEGASWSYQGKGRGDGKGPGLLKEAGATWTIEWKPGRALKAAYRKADLAAPDVYELAADPKNATRFAELITAAKNAQKYGAAVHVYSPDEYSGMRLFTTKDGQAGFALKPNGDIVSVFSMPGSGNGRAMMETAVAAGGRMLDCFNTILPGFYAPHGFKTVSRLTWDDSQAPAGWDKTGMADFNSGEPDVIFMVYDPTFAGNEGPGTAKVAADYEKAVAAQKKAVRTVARIMAEIGEGRTYQQSVWHGSPHIYDKFSLDKIGTGEGAQAFGWGLYFTSSKALGQYYRENLTTRDRAMAIDGATPAQETALRAVGWNFSHSDLVTFDEMTPEILGMWADDYLDSTGDKEVAEAIRTLPVDKIKRPEGRLYEVEIPDDGSYLLWDKPLKDQPAEVKRALWRMWAKVSPSEGIGKDVERWTLQKLNMFPDAWGKTGESAYRAISTHLAAKAIDESGMAGWTTVQNTINDRMANDRAASRALLDAGIPGIKYLDGQSRNKGDGTYNYVLFDDSLAQIKSYEQEARGEISFGDNIATISLFQARDLSTLAHETGHLWLAELEFDAKSKGASDQIKADWQTVLTFLGSDGYITREQHELFARAFETYLMEGKAPSEGLRGVFRSFKNWLISIYRNLARLQAPISPEMREVFDRLVATDEEIAAAQNAQGFNPVFTDAKSAGMTEAEFAAYTKRVNQVMEEAEQAVLEKVMASIRRQKTKEVAAEKKKIRAEVTDEMMKDPGNAALHLLRNGTLYGDAETPEALKGAKLSRPALVALIGEDGLKALPQGVYANEGIDPDDLAQVFGLGNGQELVERLMQIQAEQAAMRAKGDNRSVLNARIAEETQKRLTDRLGDPLNDGSIEAEAMAAVHSDKQGALLSSELKVLARKAGQTGAITLDDIKAWAANTIGEMSVYQATQAGKYQRAERMAGQAVQRALIKGDFVAAFKAKQDQLVNFALYLEAKKAAEDAEAVRKLADRYASAATIKSMDQGALEQIHQILEDYDFKRRSGTLLAERTTWSAWAAAQQAAGFDVIEPPRLKGTDKKHFSQMTMEEIRGLGDTIKQIAHIGRWKQEMVDGAKKRAFEEIVAEAVETAGKIDQRGVSQMRRGTSSLQDMLGDVASWFRSVDAALLKMETLLEWLDNDKTGRGVFTRVVFRRIAEAQSKERDLQKDLAGRMAAIYDKVPAEQRKAWSTQHVIPELGVKLNKSQIIAVALNIGNASNLDKMLRGEKWDEAAVRQVLNKFLSKEEWQFVQDTWDLINSMWPEIEALEKRINGVAPPKVEATPVETPFGTLPGGYYPMAYDKAGDVKADRIAAQGAEGLFDPEYRRASTRAGSTNKRVEGFNAKVLLSLNVIGQHLNEVAHDLAFREAVMDAFKFLSDDRVREAIRSAVGPEYEKQTQVWLKAVANEWAIDKRGLEGIDKFLQTARANTAVVGMGFRVSTMLSQVAGYANSVQRLGSAAMLSGMRDFWKDPAGMAAFVQGKSGEMRHRANDLERDIRLALKRMEGKDGTLDAVRRFAFRGIALFDAAVSLPTWLGAYNQGLKQGMTDAEAVAYGDKMVRDTQGAGSVKDLSAFQRGGEALKLFGMFYSYFNVFYNRQRGIVRDFRSAESFSQYMDAVAQGFWLMVVPTLLSAVLAGQGPDDEEEWWAWAMRNVGFGVLSGVPWARDVGGSISNQIAGKGFGGAKLSPIQGVGEGIQHLFTDAVHLAKGEETSKSAIKNLFNMVGLATALPTGQLGASTQFVWDALAEGSQNPEGLIDWLSGLAFGPKKQK